MSTVKHFASKQELAAAAAEYFVEKGVEAIGKNGRFAVALSGGNTPSLLFAKLISPDFRDKLNWQKVFFFWGDERCVPAESSDNNSHNARLQLLEPLEIPSDHIFPIPTTLPPEEAAAAYQKTIVDFFGKTQPAFDLILLGMGDNGHTASLFPHTGILEEQEKIVAAVYVAEVSMWRVSFTARMINQAAHILFLVAGADKKPMLDLVLDGTYQPENYPAQLIRGADWFVQY